MGWWRRGPLRPLPGTIGAGGGPPFHDRAAAGRILAQRLLGEPGAPADAPGPLNPRTDRIVVLGIPRGGVPVAAAVASALGAPLDILVAHKVGAPGEPELAVGAVASDGSVRREPWASTYLTEEEFGLAAAAEVRRAVAHESNLRGDRPAVPLAGATAVLVDDGVATGSTMLVAVEAVRRAGAARVVVAVPVAAEEAVEALSVAADALVAVSVPPDFMAVGEWYIVFDQTDDAEVRALLAGAGGA